MNKPDVETYQVPWELDHMLGILADNPPHAVLEIGSWKGGTLWHWLELADVVVAVDDELRDAETWRLWADEAGTELHTIRGDSRHAATVGAANIYGPYDLVFIDGNHEYNAVREDWLNYGRMVAPGGCIAFHDILARPGYGVDQVWAEVKDTAGVRYVEIAKNAVEPGNEGRCGIGMAWLP